MAVSTQKKIRIGDLLVQKGVISQEQLMSALQAQKASGSKIGDTLIDLGLITALDFLKLLAAQLGITYVDLANYTCRSAVVRLLPEAYARRYKAIVIEESEKDLLVGMADPTDLYAYDELSKMLKKPIRVAVVREVDMMKAVDKIYRKTEEIGSLAEELGEELSPVQTIAELPSDVALKDAPVVKLLRTVFEDAVSAGASDIHIEPDEQVLRIRQRVDGVLQEHVMQERRIAGALVSRLKLMSGLDISEKRLPQDGRFNIRVKDRNIDVRLSTMPLAHGESVVMRLLDQSGGSLNLEQIGMPAEMLRRFRAQIHNPHGMVLVTGPTGSGKTTTLYAALSELNRAERKIITAEDPVEYRLPRINQVQVQANIGLTFARVLRAALRQDPDVVMVGEMRDQETSEIGLKAAMTGHMVLSTLHTNDAVSTALRLIDMGAQGYVVASAVKAIIAQRLVRGLCRRCQKQDPLDDNQRAWLQTVLGDQLRRYRFRKGEGCPHCKQTGYTGRMAVYELLEIDADLADALRRSDSAAFSAAARRQPGYEPLALAALRFAGMGLTTVDEVMRIAGVVDENLTAYIAKRLAPQPAEPEKTRGPRREAAGRQEGEAQEEILDLTLEDVAEEGPKVDLDAFDEFLLD